MTSIFCKICNKGFTRKWNLERHLQDIHKQYIKPESHGINLESNNHDSWQRYENSDGIFEQRHNYDSINQINDSGQYRNFNNFPQNNPYPEYNYGQGYPWSNFNLQPEKEQKRWTYDDEIQLQRRLKILQNHLERFFPPLYVSGVIFMLKRRCSLEKSDEPLKKYFIQMNIGDMWSW